MYYGENLETGRNNIDFDESIREQQYYNRRPFKKYETFTYKDLKRQNNEIFTSVFPERHEWTILSRDSKQILNALEIRVGDL